MKSRSKMLMDRMHRAVGSRDWQMDKLYHISNYSDVSWCRSLSTDPRKFPPPPYYKNSLSSLFKAHLYSTIIPVEI